MEKHLVLPDVHFPFQNEKLWAATMRLVVDIRDQLDGIIISGDFVDCYSLGKYNCNSLYLLKELSLDHEYECAAKGIDDLHNALGAPGRKKRKRLEFIYGNHEDRHRRHLISGDNAKVGKALITPAEGMRLRERGWNVREDWQQDYVLLGSQLEVSHGNYTTLHPCKMHLDRMGRLDTFHGSAMFGHSHRWSTLVVGKTGAFNIGFMGDKTSKGFAYRGREREAWVNGMAIVDVDTDGDYWAQPIQCWKSSFIYNGKRY